MNRRLSSLIATAIALLGAALMPACGSLTARAGLDQEPGDSGPTTGDARTGGSSTRGDEGATSDAGFVCAPPANATRAPITFTGALFDAAQGCLAGPPVALPICGCFTDTGLDSSTWCFVTPDGTTYFGISNDQCTVQIPDGWYATQTFGPSPFGTPTSAQRAACDRVFATSTAKGSYDMPGPPACGSDGGSGVVQDAGSDSGADGGICLEVPELTASELSCDGDEDCTVVLTGTYCPDSCGIEVCPRGPANMAGQAYLNSVLPPFNTPPGQFCTCPWAGNPHCFEHQCFLCFPGDPSDSGACDPDAGTSDSGGD